MCVRTRERSMRKQEDGSGCYLERRRKKWSYWDRNGETDTEKGSDRGRGWWEERTEEREREMTGSSWEEFERLIEREREGWWEDSGGKISGGMQKRSDAIEMRSAFSGGKERAMKGWRMKRATETEECMQSEKRASLHFSHAEPAWLNKLNLFSEQQSSWDTQRHAALGFHCRVIGSKCQCFKKSVHVTPKHGWIKRGGYM